MLWDSIFKGEMFHRSNLFLPLSFKTLPAASPEPSAPWSSPSMSNIERIPLTDQDVAYLVGRGGQTRIRLENFSGARLNIDRDAAEVLQAADTLPARRSHTAALSSQVSGSPDERALARLAIDITLQQRNGGKVETDFGDLESRDDVSTFDVPKETVGFLLGAKGTHTTAHPTSRYSLSRRAGVDPRFVDLADGGDGV